jgi:glycosyltransferase involved in cell wall biosynthesis
MPESEQCVHHVLMTADAVGGVWSYALELAAQLAILGVRTTLATMGEAPRPAQVEAALQIPELHLAESRFKLEWMEDPWSDVERAGEWLCRLEERERPDIIHLNGYAHAALPWQAPCLAVAHSCVFSWWEAVLGGNPPQKYARYRDEVARGLSEADAVVAPTRAMLSALRRHYGGPAHAEVIPNGVDPAHFSPGAKEPFALAAGRFWDEGKNLRALARVAGNLRWPLAVAGEVAGGERTLRTLGWLDRGHLAEWLSRASIYVLPARYEPFGLAVLEAALSGCALVLGDIGSLREVWGDAALYALPDDFEALGDRIDRLSADDDLRVRMGAAARERGARFTAQRMAAGYTALYSKLVAGPCA